MATDISILQLPQVTEINNDDVLLVQSPNSTNILKFDDFIISLDNTTFAQTFNNHTTNIITLSTNLKSLSTNTFSNTSILSSDVSSLSSQLINNTDNINSLQTQFDTKSFSPSALADLSIFSSKIANGAITNEKLADNSITSDKLSSNNEFLLFQGQLNDDLSQTNYTYNLYSFPSINSRLKAQSLYLDNIENNSFEDNNLYIYNNNTSGSISFFKNVEGLSANFRFGINNDGNIQFGNENDQEAEVVIFGSLSKSSGSFRIDHPLESKRNTHYLYHSFIEGPRADLIYRGVVNLVDGVASINLDLISKMTEGTFVSLNRNVQVFTTNETGWTPVKGLVNNNILTIEAKETDCTDKVSWLVIGERNDQHMYNTKWTDENGQVVPEKEK